MKRGSVCLSSLRMVASDEINYFVANFTIDVIVFPTFCTPVPKSVVMPALRGLDEIRSL